MAQDQQDNDLESDGYLKRSKIRKASQLNEIAIAQECRENILSSTRSRDTVL